MARAAKKHTTAKRAARATKKPPAKSATRAANKPAKRPTAPKPLKDAPTPCVLCPPDNPRKGQHRHHLCELEHAGPADGETIPVCASHHKDIHDLGNRFDKLGGLPVLEASNLDPHWKAVLRPLLHQRALFRQQGGIAPDARRRLSIPLSAQDQQLLRFLKERTGLNSIEDTVLALIRTAAGRLQQTGRF